MNKVKLLITILLFFSGSIILVNHFQYPSVNVHGFKYEYDFSREEISDNFKNALLEGDTKLIKDEEVRVFFLITNKACPPCITNLFQYQELLGDQEIGTSILFKLNKQDPNEIHRFAGIAGFNSNYAIIDSLDLPVDLQDDISMMYFFYPNEQKIFYTSLIPNNTVTSMSYKMELIKDATRKKFWELTQ